MERSLWERRAAQDRPARPDPMTMTSADFGMGSFDLELSNALRAVAGALEVVFVMAVGMTKDVVNVVANPSKAMTA